jgi:hypothetical protein
VNEIMAYSKRVSMLMGLAAVTAVGAALPAQASVAESQGIDAVLAAETVEINFDGGLMAQSTEPTLNSLDLPAEQADALPGMVQENHSSANLLMSEQPVTHHVWVDQSALLAFETAGIETALESSVIEAAPSDFDATDLAQITRGRYDAVSPMYLGVGGNIGIGNREDSGVASFGFSVISKVSLGPRFSVRPGVLVTNQNTSFTVPLTYNFNTLEFANFRFQPYVGAGVDIPSGSDIGLLISAGADVPISRDFTLNAVSNWRVTSGFGLGITIGVGYNFPFIFE